MSRKDPPRARIRTLGLGRSERILNTYKNPSLLDEDPDVASEWGANGPFTSEHFSIGSGYNASWCCKTCGFVWVSRIQRRTGGSRRQKTRQSGCPSCRGRLVTDRNNLAFVDDEAACEFDIKLNDGARPEDVVASHQHKRYYFRCLKNTAHGPYRRTPYARTVLKRGCPLCLAEEARIRDRPKSLAAKEPLVAAVWDATRNELTPFDVGSQSHKFAHFICEHGHRQYLRIYDKVRRPHCPDCMNEAARLIAHQNNRPSKKARG